MKDVYNPANCRYDKEITVTGRWTVNALARAYRLLVDSRVIVSVQWHGGGGFLSRGEWDNVLPIGATVRFVWVPRGGGGKSNVLQIVAMIAVVALSYFTGGAVGAAYGAAWGAVAGAAVSIAGSLLLNYFFYDESSSSIDSTENTVYSINSGSNSMRIGSPFTEHFGRRKIYPDLIQNSYARFENNDQYLYFYGIVGVGQYEIEGVFIDETLATEYDTEFNVLQPGEAATICNLPCWVSAEIGGQNIDTEGVKSVLSGRGTVAHQIEYDVQFQGLVRYSDDGGVNTVSVTVVAEVRLVDDEAQPASEWVELHRRTYARATADTLRFTDRRPAPLGPGRYEIWIYRTTEPSEDTKTRDDCTVIGAKAFGAAQPDFGDCTRLEMKVLATEKLNGQVSNKINVIATRKLPKVTATGFERASDGLTLALYPTTSIVDAVAYMVCSENGGRMPESFLRFGVLADLRSKYITLGHSFNWSFSAQGSVMDACVKAATCSRSVPYLPGGEFCLVRDEYQDLPAVTYTDDDIEEGSFTITHTLPDPSSLTCVTVTYISEYTWDTDTVTYYDDRGSEDRPYEITLEGCQSRQQAYEHAAYIYLDAMENRSEVKFTTGLKGHIPTLFKKLAVCANNVDWGQSGIVAAIEDGKIWLSEPADFHEQSSGKLYLSLPDGSTGGPYTVSPSDSVYCVYGDIGDVATLIDDDVMATKYLFGPSSEELMMIRLTTITPQSRGKIEISGIVISDNTYTDPGGVYDPDGLPAATDITPNLFLKDLGDTTYYALWSSAASIFKIEVDTGSEYVTVEDEINAFSAHYTTIENSSSIRITPYVDGVLMVDSASEVSYTIIQSPTNIEIEEVNGVFVDSLHITWDAVAGAGGYNVSVTVEETTKLNIYVETAEYYLTDISMDTLNIPWSGFTVGIEAVSSSDDNNISDPVYYSWVGSNLTAPVGLAVQSLLSNAITLTWGGVSSATGYVLYLGESADFDPATAGTLVYSGASTFAIVAANLTSPYDYFFKVAATDQWHMVVGDLVFSDSLHIGTTGGVVTDNSGTPVLTSTGDFIYS